MKKPSTWAHYKALLRKDLAQELHTKEMITSMGLYALLVLVVYGASLAQAGSELDIQQMAGGLLWVVVLFTSLLGLNRSFSHEKENGCLESILLVPMDRSVIFLAKATANLVFLLIVEVICVPLFFFFFLGTVGAAETWPLMFAPLLVGTIGIAGIGTLVQLFPLAGRIGSGLPIVMGISFTFVTVLCGVAATYGFNAAIGAIMVGGLIEGVLGLFAKYWRWLISPIVAAVVVTSIGFSLLSVGAASFGGGSGSPDFGSPQNIALGSIALISCLVFQIMAKGKTKQLSVLFGLVIGYVAALFMGMVDFSGFASAKPVSIPEFMPFAPEFHPSAILAVTLIFLVSATETIGDTSALARVGLGRDVREKELSGSIACDGFVSSVSACFGCLPITSFSQNVGLVAMTKVVNRRAIATGAIIMILAAFLPVISVVFSSLPDAVLGGCTIMMFGNIIVSGFQMIARAGFTQRNILIAALSLSIGIGFTQVSEIFVLLPEMLQNVFADNCVAVVFLVAVIANLVLPKDISVDGAEAEGAAEHYREAQEENDARAEFDAVRPEETRAAAAKS